MLSYLLLSSVLVAFASTETLILKNLRTDEPEANGSFDFKYTNDQTEKAASTLKKFYTDAESEKNKYVVELKTSNEASKLLKEYEKAASSVNGTKCEVPKENKKIFTGAQENNIETSVEVCAAVILKDDFDTLNKTVTEDLAKVQAIDNTVRLNYQICASLRVPPSNSCQNSLQQALDRIKSVLTQEELMKLTNLSEQASEGAKRSLEQCVHDGTKDLVESLSESIKTISDCKDSQ